MQTSSSNRAPQSVRSLIDTLYSGDGQEREIARRSLVKIRKMAVAPLIDLLADTHVQVRWEAAKALGKIGGLEAAEGLVTCLYDEDCDVRWMATEGLIDIGTDAVAPLLRTLIGGFNSIWVREGALHVLHALAETALRDMVMPVIRALEDGTSAFAVPVAAHDALDILRKERRLQIIRSVLHDYR